MSPTDFPPTPQVVGTTSHREVVGPDGSVVSEARTFTEVLLVVSQPEFGGSNHRKAPGAARVAGPSERVPLTGVPESGTKSILSSSRTRDRRPLRWPAAPTSPANFYLREPLR